MLDPSIQLTVTKYLYIKRDRSRTKILDYRSTMEPAEILTTVNYYLPPERGGPDQLYEIGTVGTRRRKKDPHTVRVQNVRLQDKKFDLDTHGFAFEKHSTTFTDWTNDEKVQKEYWPQVAAFLKEL